MARVVFVTCEEFPGLADCEFVRDDLAADAIRKHGLRVDPGRWDDPAVQWASYDVIVMRTTWDYHLRLDEFRAWMTLLEQTGVLVFNSLEIVRWNINKRYLRELDKAGIQVPLTEFFSKRSTDFPSLRSLMDSSNLNQVVIKPCVSASAYKTSLVRSPEDVGQGQRDLECLLKERDCMVQEFIPEVATKGEWSVMFFNRVFSHAVVKIPPYGDFRAQYGCTIIPKEPSEEMLAMAQRALEQVKGDLLYARVDMEERDNGQLVLMELEVIEPQLFFDQHPDATENFASALCELLGK